MSSTVETSKVPALNLAGAVNLPGTPETQEVDSDREIQYNLPGTPQVQEFKLEDPRDHQTSEFQNFKNLINCRMAGTALDDEETSSIFSQSFWM